MPLTETDCEIIKELFDNSHRNQSREYTSLLEEVREELKACKERESSISWMRAWLMMFRLKLGQTEFEVSLAGVITVIGITLLVNYLNI